MTALDQVKNALIFLENENDEEADEPLEGVPMDSPMSQAFPGLNKLPSSGTSKGQITYEHQVGKAATPPAVKHEEEWKETS